MDKYNLSTYRYVSTNFHTPQKTSQYWNQSIGNVEVKSLSSRQVARIFAAYVYISRSFRIPKSL